MKTDELKIDVRNLLASFKQVKCIEMGGAQMLHLSLSIERLMKFVESKEEEKEERPIIGEDARD